MKEVCSTTCPRLCRRRPRCDRGVMGSTMTIRARGPRRRSSRRPPTSKVFFDDGPSLPARATSARWPRRVAPLSPTQGSGEVGPHVPGPRRGPLPLPPATWPMMPPTGRSRCSAGGSNCINTGGEKVYPEEVEEALKAHPAVEDAWCSACPTSASASASSASSRSAPAWSRRPTTSSPTRGTPVELQAAEGVAPRAAVPRAPNGKADYRTARGDVSSTRLTRSAAL